MFIYMVKRVYNSIDFLFHELFKKIYSLSLALSRGSSSFYFFPTSLSENHLMLKLPGGSSPYGRKQ